MKIADVRAYATSFPVPPEARVTLGIGQAVKRDAVVVKVTTDDGLIGWGESHHGRSPGAVAHHANTTLRQLILGMDAADVVGVWARIYKMQLGSHGMGAATAIAMSGIDMALWDIRGKAVGWPLYKMLGGAQRAIPAYAGGVSLGPSRPRLPRCCGSCYRKGRGGARIRRPGLQGAQAPRGRYSVAGSRARRRSP